MSTEATSKLALLPARPVMIGAIKLLLVVLLPVAVAGLFLGGGGVIVSGLVVVMTVAQATVTRGSTQSWFVLAVAVFAALGTLGHHHPLVVALTVAAAALLSYPANRVSAGLLGLAPVLVVLEGLGDINLVWWQALLCAFLVGCYIVAVVRILYLRVPASPVSQQIALTHAIVFALAAAGFAFIVVKHDLPHGYWMIVTLAVVLRPNGSESRLAARERVAGTIIGSLIAVLVAMVLPTSVALVFAALLLWLVLGYMLSHRQLATVITTSVFVIVVVSSTGTTDTLTVAWQRLLWTAIGAATALVLGLLLQRMANQPKHDDAPVPTS